MYIKRDFYLNRLIGKIGNGLIKVITGVRRCGKSFILFNIFYDYLKSQGVDDGHIIRLELDREQNAFYRNPVNLGSFLRERMGQSLFLWDEIKSN